MWSRKIGAASSLPSWKSWCAFAYLAAFEGLVNSCADPASGLGHVTSSVAFMPCVSVSCYVSMRATLGSDVRTSSAGRAGAHPAVARRSRQSCQGPWRVVLWLAASFESLAIQALPPGRIPEFMLSLTMCVLFLCGLPCYIQL